MPPRALKCLLYYKNFFRIGPETKHGIYIRHLIGRSLRVDSEHSAKLPDKGFLGVSYYEEVVRGENCYFGDNFEQKWDEIIICARLFYLNEYITEKRRFNVGF